MILVIRNRSCARSQRGPEPEGGSSSASSDELGEPDDGTPRGRGNDVEGATNPCVATSCGRNSERQGIPTGRSRDGDIPRDARSDRKPLEGSDVPTSPDPTPD
jgi:hypothetical protein